MAAGATMMAAASRCPSGVTAAVLEMRSSARGIRVELNSTKWQLQCSGLKGAAAAAVGATPKTAFFSPGLIPSSVLSCRLRIRAAASNFESQSAKESEYEGIPPSFCIEWESLLCYKAQTRRDRTTAERRGGVHDENGSQVLTDNMISPSKVIVLENYDNFTENLCQYLGDLGCDYEVIPSEVGITVADLKESKPRGIVISPAGPGTPQDSGIRLPLSIVMQVGSEVPILGVCMALECGREIVRDSTRIFHGKTSRIPTSSPVFSRIYYDEKGEDGIFAGLPNPFIASPYRSLEMIESRENFPREELDITAWTEDGLIMGIRHRQYKHFQAVHFHPESIITEDGKKIVTNFLKILEQKDASGHANLEEPQVGA